MQHRALVNRLRIDTVDGSATVHPIGIHPGGKAVKRIHYSIVVHQVSNANVRIGLRLDHGPDGKNNRTHSTPIDFADPGTPPVVLEGTVSDETTMINEHRHPCLLIKDTALAAAMWAVVSVYETVKPF